MTRNCPLWHPLLFGWPSMRLQQYWPKRARDAALEWGREYWIRSARSCLTLLPYFILIIIIIVITTLILVMTLSLSLTIIICNAEFRLIDAPMGSDGAQSQLHDSVHPGYGMSTNLGCAMRVGVVPLGRYGLFPFTLCFACATHLLQWSSSLRFAPCPRNRIGT